MLSAHDMDKHPIQHYFMHPANPRLTNPSQTNASIELYMPAHSSS